MLKNLLFNTGNVSSCPKATLLFNLVVALLRCYVTHTPANIAAFLGTLVSASSYCRVGMGSASTSKELSSDLSFSHFSSF